MKNRYEIVGDVVKVFVNNIDGMFFTVSKDKLDILHSLNVTWYAKRDYNSRYPKYYIMANIKRGDRHTTIQLHRFLTGAEQGYVVDHCSSNTWDNSDDNLKVCLQKENAKNRKNTRKLFFWDNDNNTWNIKVAT